MSKQNASSKKHPCKECEDWPPSERCVQTKFVRKNSCSEFEKAQSKGGITAVPENECMLPKKVSYLNFWKMLSYP